MSHLLTLQQLQKPVSIAGSSVNSQRAPSHLGAAKSGTLVAKDIFKSFRQIARVRPWIDLDTRMEECGTVDDVRIWLLKDDGGVERCHAAYGMKDGHVREVG